MKSFTLDNTLKKKAFNLEHNFSGIIIKRFDFPTLKNMSVTDASKLLNDLTFNHKAMDIYGASSSNSFQFKTKFSSQSFHPIIITDFFLPEEHSKENLSFSHHYKILELELTKFQSINIPVVISYEEMLGVSEILQKP